MTKEQKDTYRDFITKPEIQFFLPLIVYIVMLTVFFMSLKNGQDLITQKLDIFTQKVDNLTAAINTLEHKVTVLNAIHNIQ